MQVRGSPVERMLHTVYSMIMSFFDPLLAAIGAGQHKIALAHAGPACATSSFTASLKRHDGDVSPFVMHGRPSMIHISHPLLAAGPLSLECQEGSGRFGGSESYSGDDASEPLGVIG
jgi:hypothetical protein